MNAIRIDFDGDDPTRFRERVRQATAARPAPAVIIDLSHAKRLDAGALEVLGDSLRDLSEAGAEVWVESSHPPVYKALLLAKLGPLFERLHRGGAGAVVH